jgi:hypothetical protein
MRPRRLTGGFGIQRNFFFVATRSQAGANALLAPKEIPKMSSTSTTTFAKLSFTLRPNPIRWPRLPDPLAGVQSLLGGNHDKCVAHLGPVHGPGS